MTPIVHARLAFAVSLVRSRVSLQVEIYAFRLLAWFLFLQYLPQVPMRCVGAAGCPLALGEVGDPPPPVPTNHQC